VQLARIVSAVIVLAAGPREVLGTGQTSEVVADSPRVWTPAVFQGRRIGEATRASVLAPFGSPDRIESYSAKPTGGYPIE